MAMESQPEGRFSDFVGKEPPPPTPSKRRFPWKILALVVLALALLCGVLTLVATLTGRHVALKEEPAIAETLDSLMQSMAAGDIDAAYGLFSPRAQRQFPQEDLAKLAAMLDGLMFKGYESLTIERLIISKSFNTNPDLPQGTVAQVQAVVHYQGGHEGRLTAVLEKVEGQWRLHHFNVTVPPEMVPSSLQ